MSAHKALLDFTREFDPQLLDQVVQALYSGSGGKEVRVIINKKATERSLTYLRATSNNSHSRCSRSSKIAPMLGRAYRILWSGARSRKPRSATLDASAADSDFYACS